MTDDVDYNTKNESGASIRTVELSQSLRVYHISNQIRSNNQLLLRLLLGQ